MHNAGMDIKAHLAKLAQRMTIDQISAAAGCNRSTVVRAKAGRNITVASHSAIMAVRPPKKGKQQ